MALLKSRGSKALVMQQAASDDVTEQVYAPSSGMRAVITKIIITNVTGTTITDYKVYIDIDGSTYDENSALIDGAAIADTAFEMDFPDGFEIDENANVAIRTSQSGGLLFTILGQEFDEID